MTQNPCPFLDRARRGSVPPGPQGNAAALSPGEDAMTGDTDKYLGPQDLRELGDDSLPQEGYLGFSIGARSASSDRSNTLNRSSFTRDSMMIEEILAPSKETHLTVSRECDSDSTRRYSWAADAMDNVHLVSSPVHSGFLVSFMVDARGGSMRGSRHNGMRIIIPPRKCTAPTRITCRLVKRHKLACPPPMVEGEGLASRLVEVGPAGAQFLGPVIVEIPHFGSMRGNERELIVLRSENGDTWKEHQYDYKTEDLNKLLGGMDEELDSPEELEKKRICRIISKDFPQYFAVVSRIKQESNQMGPEGGVLSSMTVPLVQASFPEGALTKKIRVGLQAQPVPDETVKKILGNRATFSPIVTVEPRRRKFHKPITMTIPVPPLSGEGVTNGYKGDTTPCLRLLCSITGGTSPAQWEDITGTTPLTFVNDCVSFTTNVSARFWLADCHQIPETVGLASQLYRELICVPYMAKFVVFAKMTDVVESSLRCFCMTDDKVDKTLEQQENFEEVARSKDIEVLEGKPIYVDCYGNLVPLTKASQQLVLNFYAFKENRLPFSVKVRDSSQEPCGRLSFLKESKTTKGLPQTAVCNLNITLPAHKKGMESDPDDETEKPDRRQTFASLALRPQSPCERTDLRMAIVADHLGLSWTELAREMDFSVDEINRIRVENPNSLTAQSFMLLKRWVSRDGKNATTDALTAVLTKINRMDIVTLLEGPIFDYGYQNIELDLQTPVELNYEPPTPLRQDDFFGEEPSIDSPNRNVCRPCNLSLPSPLTPAASPPTDREPPTVTAEDTSIGCLSGKDRDVAAEEEDAEPAYDSASSHGLHDVLRVVEEDDVFGEQEQHWACSVLPAGAHAARVSNESGSEEEEEEEMIQEKLKSLLQDVKLEEGSEGEEMTEERVQAILLEVKQAEQDISSLTGLQSDITGVNVESATPGHSLIPDLVNQQEDSQENATDSVTSASKGQEGKLRQNGEHPPLAAPVGSIPMAPSSANGQAHGDTVKQKMAQAPVSFEGVEKATLESSKDEETLLSEHKIQEHRSNEFGSDEEQTVTTRVIRRRVILKGEQAKNIPGESVTEEQFTDEDGNVITRKVIRKVIRRVVTSDGREQEVKKREGGSKQTPKSEAGACSEVLGTQKAKAKPEEGTKKKKKEGRQGEKKMKS